MKKDFSIKEALTFGWNTMKANFWFFVGILIVAALAIYVPILIAALLYKSVAFIGFLFQLAGYVASVIVTIGVIKIALKFSNNERPEFNELFAFQGFFWRYVGGTILFALIYAGGIILLVVPGIMWAIMFQFYGYCIIDQNLGIMDALKRSAALTKTVRWKVFGLVLLFILINWLGALVLFIGLFATIPTTLVANAYVYRKLLSQTQAAVPIQGGAAQ